jgi:hypothetical protein
MPQGFQRDQLSFMRDRGGSGWKGALGDGVAQNVEGAGEAGVLLIKSSSREVRGGRM